MFFGIAFAAVVFIIAANMSSTARFVARMLWLFLVIIPFCILLWWIGAFGMLWDMSVMILGAIWTLISLFFEAIFGILTGTAGRP